MTVYSLLIKCSLVLFGTGEADEQKKYTIIEGITCSNWRLIPHYQKHRFVFSEREKGAKIEYMTSMFKHIQVFGNLVMSGWCENV